MIRRLAVVAALAVAVCGPVAAQPAEDVRVEALVGLARTLRDAGRTGEAAAAFRDARQARPADAALRQEAFWVEIEAAPAEGLALARVILADDPTRHAVRERAIAAAASLGDDALAGRLAQDGARVAPPDPRWPRHEGEAALRRGDAAAAATAFERAHALGSDHHDLAMYALALEAAGRAPAAWRAWSTVPAALVEGRPDWRDSRLRAAIAAAPLGVAEQAVRARCAESAAAPAAQPPCPMGGPDGPTTDSWWRLLANRAAAEGDPRRALAALDPLLAGPTRHLVLRRASDLAANAGDLPTAIRHVRALVLSGQAHPDDRVRLVELVARQGDGAAVLEAATQAGLTPCDARVMTALSAADDATPLITAALTRAPACDDWLGWRVRAAHAALARQDFSSAVALLDPIGRAPACARAPLPAECLDALDLLGRAQAWSGDHAAAVVTLTRVLAQDGSRSHALDALIDAHRALGHHQDAWAAVRARRPLLPPVDAARQMTWAEVAVEAGEPAEARALASTVPAADLRRRRDGVLLIAAAALRLDDEALALCATRSPRTDAESAACDTSAMRLATARRDAGDLPGALALLRTLAAPDAETAALRASLTVAVEGPAAGRREFEAIVERSDAMPAAFVALADLQLGARSRLATLEAGWRRFPGDPAIGEALARAQRDAGEAQRALETALAVLRHDRARPFAWTAAVEAAASAAPTQVPSLLAEMEAALASDPGRLAEAATAIGWLAVAPGDAVATSTLRWLGAALAEGPDTRLLVARARVHAATRAWRAALADLDAAIASSPADAEAAKLRAEVLSYAGRHGEALDAYDRYLRLRPEDEAARRQQARVAGWAQDADDMRRRYAALLASAPGNAAVRAEAEAKDAFLRGDWDAAVPAYLQWLALEPGDREAAFELAQAEAQRGAVAEARRAFERVAAWTPVHREAAIARARFEAARRPAARPYSSWQSSNGYGGQRVLDLAETGVTGRLTLGAAERADLRVGGGSVTVTGAGARWAGTAWQAGLFLRPTGDWRVSAEAGATTVAGITTPSFDVAAQWRPEAGWTLHASVARARWCENATTVSEGLATTRVGAGVQWRGLDTTFEADGARRAITDGNDAWSTTALVRHRVRRGRDELAVIGWAEWQGFNRRAAAYFSPAGFLRADAGLEWRRALMRPRFADDLARHVTATYLAGVDDRGVIYHHPSVRAAWELNDGLAVEAVADWLRSEVFDQTRLWLQVRVGGAGRR